MKRSEMIEKVAKTLAADFEGDATYVASESQMFMFRGLANAALCMVEEAGMLPPTCTVKMVPDTYRNDGTTKHSETKREWDEE